MCNLRFDSIDLESSSKIWKMYGLPARQKSFTLWTASDTLPKSSPLDISSWPKVISVWQLLYLCVCVLNGCQCALEQSKFSWIHDCILACIAATWEALHSSTHLFLDLPEKLLSENPPSTFLNNLCYTTLKPDIVMLTDLQLYVVELTVPMNSLSWYS